MQAAGVRVGVLGSGSTGQQLGVQACSEASNRTTLQWNQEPSG